MKWIMTAGLSLLYVAAFAQQPNWQHLDLRLDSIFGISTNMAYELLKGKTPKPVIVAVIDGGVDTLHEDLKSVLWINPKKKKMDYGTYGWSFAGPVRYDNLELTRQVRQYEQRDTTKLNNSELAVYHKEKTELQQKLAHDQQGLKNISKFSDVLNNIVMKIGKTSPALADFKAFTPTGSSETQVTRTVIKELSKKDDFLAFKKDNLDDALAYYHTSIDYQLNTAYDPRANGVEDEGSPDAMGPDAHHGTHVAGIIGAVRNNGIGMDGIADDVRILSVRAVPDGDERDKDVANAIRYAADHGAKVINMSFGKGYSQDKKAVDKAVAYALKKDVLLVQAAGNDNKNIDSTANFPRRVTADEAYIVVGASDSKGKKADFSNYGVTSVDVFAPGVQIYSTIPGNQYAYFNGTSMAAPVVAGLAALIREYYPNLKAKQVKDLILESIVKGDGLNKYCLTGGVVNAYNALQAAAAL